MKALEGINSIQNIRVALCKTRQRVMRLIKLDGSLKKSLQPVVVNLVGTIHSLGLMKGFIHRGLKHSTKVPKYGMNKKLFTGGLLPKPVKSTELFDIANEISRLSNGVDAMRDNPVNKIIVNTASNTRIKATKKHFENQEKAFKGMADSYTILTAEIKKANEEDAKTAAILAEKKAKAKKK